MAVGSKLMTGTRDWLGRRALLGVALAAGLGWAGALVACEETPPRPGLERVVVKGKTFWVEPALDDTKRVPGLGKRESLAENEGMLFVFPFSSDLSFVMRDCKFDIDIAFLDDVGRVVSMHTMKVEPRNPGESDIDYERRLKKYPSRFSSRMALEVLGGTFSKLGLEAGDQIELDAEGLKKRAK